MAETKLNFRMVGSYTGPQAVEPSYCTKCHNALWGTIIINGICAECLMSRKKLFITVEDQAELEDGLINRLVIYLFPQNTEDAAVKLAQCEETTDVMTESDYYAFIKKALSLAEQWGAELYVHVDREDYFEEK